MLLWIYKTVRTGALLTTDDKTLLRVICDIGCENWVDGAYKSISTIHVNAILSSINQGLQEGALYTPPPIPTGLLLDCWNPTRLN